MRLYTRADKASCKTACRRVSSITAAGSSPRFIRGAAGQFTTHVAPVSQLRCAAITLAAAISVALPAALSAQRATGSLSASTTQTQIEPRLKVAPGLKSRSPALQDPKYAVNAMKLTALQEQRLAQMRARFAPSIQAYVARLNALDRRGVARDTLVATEDTLKAILAAEHAAADSLITPDQKQRYLNALRQVHVVTVINPAGITRAAVNSPTNSTLVPVPQINPAAKKP